MGLPHDRFIRFLATKGIDDIKDMNKALGLLKLPAISQEDLDEVWNLLHRTLSKNMINNIERKIYNSEFLKNMYVLEVGELWLMEAPFNRRDDRAKEMNPCLRFVYSIHEDGWLRTNINALFIKNVSVEEISRILSAKFSMAVREKHLDYYRKFFFETSAMTRAAWKSYINSYKGKEYQIYFTALTDSVEVLKTELELPAVVSVSDTLQYLLTKSMTKAKTYLNMGSVEAGKEARAWIEQVVQLSDKYEKHRSGDQHDFAKALQMEFDFTEEDFGTPDADMAHELHEKTRPKDESEKKK